VQYVFKIFNRKKGLVLHSFNKDIGNYGEALAESYLTSIGFLLVDKNFKCRQGEIDLICKDGSYIVFVEVKSRYSSYFGTPADSVTYKKQRKIFKVAQFYIMKNMLHDNNFRFDVVEVILNTSDNKYDISLIKNAFQLI
jgi:putative endonuclease